MTWTCARCDTVNEADSSRCAVCAAPRPPSAGQGGGEPPTQLWGAPPAAVAAASPAWCRACGSEIGPDARFCPRCGADQFASAAGEATTVLAAPLAVAGTTAAPATAHVERGGAGRTVAAVLGVIFVAVIAGLAAFALASRSSNDAAPPSSRADNTSPAVNAGTSSTTSSSTSTSTTSTTPASTTSTAPGSTTTAVGPGKVGVAIPTPGASKDDLAALDLAQQLATALATKDAAALARLEPGKAATGYDDLRASTVILKSVEPAAGGTRTLRLGLVAHEETTDRHTHVYCVTWTVDLAAGHVTETGKGSTASDVTPGWVDPATMVDYVRTSC